MFENISFLSSCCVQCRHMCHYDTMMIKIFGLRSNTFVRSGLIKDRDRSLGHKTYVPVQHVKS